MKKSFVPKVMLFVSLVTTAIVPGLQPAQASASGSAPNLEGLTGVVQPLIDKAWEDGIRVSVGIEDLSGAYGHDGVLLGRDETYKPASTIKMALVTTLMQQVDKGTLKLEDTVTVEPSDVVGGTGSLQKEQFPQDVSLDRLARLTITQSDNTATNVLIDVVGLDKVRALLDGLDMEVMHLGRKMFAAAPTPEQDNYINAEDMVKLLKHIYDGSILTRESRNQLIAWMGAQEVNTKFGGALPDAPIAHKTGENANVTHDVGYFLVPGREIAISVMTEVNTTDKYDEAQAIGNPVVQQIAKAVYNQLVEDSAVDSGKSITRAEFTSLLARELGLKSSSQAKAFSDVASSSPVYGEIMAAREAGIVSGLSDTIFGGDTVITRAEMVTMFIRAYELVHGKVGTDVTELAYSDQATIPAWAIESIAKATFLNKVKSYSGSTFEPLKQANYSDAAKVISGLWVSSN